ncbi:MAG: topoisomerase catalytic core domain protein [Gemmatimonadetes bacterium]|nr:topoisomerase catalytic core domain protein [Gemmatimonadota bacterium]
MAEWITREGGKTRFRYARNDKPVRDERTLERIRLLAVPPAWTNVHIAASASAEVQAWGLDAKGRKQYRYHTRAVERGQLRKYYRVREMAKELPELRKRIRTHAASRTPSRRAAAAAVVRLISESFFRIGSEKYATENKTFGIATLRKRHVQVADGRAVFNYVGKKSIKQRQVVANRELTRLVKRYMTMPGARLFRYQDGRKWRDLTSRDVNAYLHETLGVDYSAKDFRTWGGTLRAATVLAELGPADSPTEAKRNVATTMRLVASELGNTPAICRSSYVHPMVIARYVDDGETIKLPASYASRADVYAHSPEERALIRFLDAHFPERRKRTRA